MKINGFSVYVFCLVNKADERRARADGICQINDTFQLYIRLQMLLFVLFFLLLALMMLMIGRL